MSAILLLQAFLIMIHLTNVLSFIILFISLCLIKKFVKSGVSIWNEKKRRRKIKSKTEFRTIFFLLKVFYRKSKEWKIILFRWHQFRWLTNVQNNCCDEILVNWLPILERYKHKQSQCLFSAHWRFIFILHIYTELLSEPSHISRSHPKQLRNHFSAIVYTNAKYEIFSYSDNSMVWHQCETETEQFCNLIFNQFAFKFKFGFWWVLFVLFKQKEHWAMKNEKKKKIWRTKFN